MWISKLLLAMTEEREGRWCTDNASRKRSTTTCHCLVLNAGSASENVIVSISRPCHPINPHPITISAYKNMSKLINQSYTSTTSVPHATFCFVLQLLTRYFSRVDTGTGSLRSDTSDGSVRHTKPSNAFLISADCPSFNTTL